MHLSIYVYLYRSMPYVSVHKWSINRYYTDLLHTLAYPYMRSWSYRCVQYLWLTLYLLYTDALGFFSVQMDLTCSKVLVGLWMGVQVAFIGCLPSSGHIILADLYIGTAWHLQSSFSRFQVGWAHGQYFYCHFWPVSNLLHWTKELQTPNALLCLYVCSIDLTNHLKFIAANDELYASYFWWKSFYTVDNGGYKEVTLSIKDSALFTHYC